LSKLAGNLPPLGVKKNILRDEDFWGTSKATGKANRLGAIVQNGC